ncbi:hypothetical protein SAMN06269117_1029 [Balnearium lithotrophicum]|jgi:predicted RNA-binding protein YlxR (DUF448 family)|uniref:Uncharacterized protein n=1 Tax=Balnearium lithotrophicum TaxID=223788 RepID=A0A521AJY1_9BACT|nr:hypothetical protein [Balnearium lithotrophicum]SMO35135.1 hypothetical protein SAMN06269117_1029 [Balnearium lithotrophicum]
MARGKRGRKKGVKSVKLSLPKRTYYILYGIAGNNEQKLNRLIKLIVEEKLENSTVSELSQMLEPKKREEEEESTEE